MNRNSDFSIISQEIYDLSEKCVNRIDPALYSKYDVKRGLRESSGKGVLTGLTDISDVNGFRLTKGKKIPTDGELYYHGYNVKEMIEGFRNRNTPEDLCRRCGFARKF